MELPGKSGREIMESAMLHLRCQPPRRLGGVPVAGVADRLDEDLRGADSYSLGSSADIVSFFMSDDRRTRVTVRPSGTEPKLKVYVQHYGPARGDLASLKADVDATAMRLGRNMLGHCRDGLPPQLREVWERAGNREV